MAWIFSAALVRACASLPSSPEPAAASSPATSSATAPSAPSSGTRMPQAYSSDSKTLATYRRSRYGMTCKPLTAAHGEALLTVFLAGFHAPTSQSQAAAPASTASSPGSGASSPGWFVRWDQSGCEWRTAQRSLLGDSESFSETWPRSGLMRAGMCFPRPTAAPRIFVSGSGSSPGVVYPTPCTVDCTGTRFNQSDSLGAALRPTLGAMAKYDLWPTPTVTGNNNRPGASAKAGMGLATAARLWPTPTASEAGRGRTTVTGGRSPGRTTSLTGQVNQQMWPTPNAGDAKQTGNVRVWEERERKKDEEGIHLQENLAIAVQRRSFPTPAARDYRHPNAKSFEERGGGKKGEQLPNSVGGPLNPEFVEWLMGWPQGWTAVPGHPEYAASGTARFHEWLQQHGCCWRTS